MRETVEISSHLITINRENSTEIKFDYCQPQKNKIAIFHYFFGKF